MTTRDESLGLWLGVVGVALFAVTLPMTIPPQISPLAGTLVVGASPF